MLFLVESPKDLIRKLLVVEASQRITVTEALHHEFFQVVVSLVVITETVLFLNELVLVKLFKKYCFSKFQHCDSKPFNARKSFRFAILCVRCALRIQRLKNTPEPLSLNAAAIDPYRIKAFRKVPLNLYLFVYLSL